LYLCLPPIWGAVGGDLLNPRYSWDCNRDQINQHNRSKGPKKEEGLPYKEIPMRNTSAGAGCSGAPLRDPVTTSEPAADISTKGRDEAVVRNLPEVKLGTFLFGISGTDTPLQGASISGLPIVGEELGHLVSGVGGLH
jgi:hypothetical protein